jgi:hypothetical protein
LLHPVFNNLEQVIIFRRVLISIGNRNKKPILIDVIYLFCNLKKP